MRLPNAVADSTIDSGSNGTARGVVMFLTIDPPTTSARAAIGSTAKNIQRQLRLARMNPEKVGPTAGATEMTTEIMPIVRPRRETGTKVITVVMSSGSMTAVPLAWMTRAATSTGNTGASAARRVPAVNVPIALMKTARVENRVRMRPVVGMTTAMVSMKAVVSHCAVAAVTENSVMSRGIATLITVSLRIMTNEATMRTPMTSFTWRGTVSSAPVSAAGPAVGFWRWSTLMGLPPGGWVGRAAVPHGGSSPVGATLRRRAV